MMNSLYKTLTKTPRIRLSALSFSSEFCTTKYSSVLAIQAQDAVAMKEKHETEVSNKANSWPKPGEIPFQSKVANWVNLIGTIRLPIQFITLADGKSWAGTVISQNCKYSDVRLFWVPVIFEGDLAHTAAFHLKVLDTVHIAGELNSDPLPINLTNDRVDIQVKVHDIHFVRGFSHMKNFHRK